MTLLEAQTLTLRVLKQVMEEKLDHHNVQLAQVYDHYSCLLCIVQIIHPSGNNSKGIRNLGRDEIEGSHRSNVIHCSTRTKMLELISIHSFSCVWHLGAAL